MKIQFQSQMVGKGMNSLVKRCRKPKMILTEYFFPSFLVFTCNLAILI